MKPKPRTIALAERLYSDRLRLTDARAERLDDVREARLKDNARMALTEALLFEEVLEQVEAKK